MRIEYQSIRDLAVVMVCTSACLTDLRLRRVPNWLTFGAAAAGVAFNAVAGGPSAAGMAVAGWLTGAALLFPWFLLGGMGAGDVKLVAALGAFLGPAPALWLVLYSAIAGGVLAIFVALAHGYVRTAFRNIWALIRHWRTVGLRPLPDLTLDGGRGPRLPYALPIAAGTLVTLWLR